MNARTSGPLAHEMLLAFDGSQGIHGPQLNGLLAALPDEEYDRLRPHLRLVHLALGQVLHEPGTGMSHVYFPATAIVSLLYVMS